MSEKIGTYRATLIAEGMFGSTNAKDSGFDVDKFKQIITDLILTTMRLKVLNEFYSARKSDNE